MVPITYTAWREGRYHAEADNNSVHPRINAGLPAKADETLPRFNIQRDLRQVTVLPVKANKTTPSIWGIFRLMSTRN